MSEIEILTKNQHPLRDKQADTQQTYDEMMTSIERILKKCSPDIDIKV